EVGRGARHPAGLADAHGVRRHHQRGAGRADRRGGRHRLQGGRVRRHHGVVRARNGAGSRSAGARHGGRGLRPPWHGIAEGHGEERRAPRRKVRLRLRRRGSLVLSISQTAVAEGVTGSLAPTGEPFLWNCGSPKCRRRPSALLARRPARSSKSIPAISTWPSSSRSSSGAGWYWTAWCKRPNGTSSYTMKCWSTWLSTPTRIRAASRWWAGATA